MREKTDEGRPGRVREALAGMLETALHCDDLEWGDKCGLTRPCDKAKKVLEELKEAPYEISRQTDDGVEEITYRVPKVSDQDRARRVLEDYGLVREKDTVQFFADETFLVYSEAEALLTRLNAAVKNALKDERIIATNQVAFLAELSGFISGWSKEPWVRS